MRTQLVIFHLLIITCILFSCDEGPKLTKATESGENTFSCKVNGQVMIARSSLFGSKGVVAGYNHNDSSFSISGHEVRDGSNVNIDVYLELKRLSKPGTYSLNDTIHNFGSCTLREQNLNRNYYHTNNYLGENKGRVVISKLDTEKKIIAGTFEFTATSNDSTSKTIIINNGRFDVTYD